MNIPAATAAGTARERGFALGITVHVVLLVAIAAMVVYLASRYRVRIDLTADRLYTLTESTTRVLDRVDDRLRIEAYFSPDSALAAVHQEARRTLRNVLDEYVQRGRGRVVVQYLDPSSDVELEKKAQRLGIQPQTVQDLDGKTFSAKQVWQGLRFLYGGARQKVVPFLGFTDQPWMYEAALTPIVKALTVEEKPKIGVVAWPSTPAQSPGFGRQEQPRGYDQVLGVEQITDRYEIVRVDLSLGQLVPDELDTLILLRPRELTARQKYAFDQFLMRGGRLVVFADSDDVSIGRTRTFATQQVSWDAAESGSRFLEQLAHYGAVVHDRFLVDRLSPQLPFNVVVQTQTGGQGVVPLRYPYWYQPAAVDWADYAKALAETAEGGVDEALVAAYRRQFEPGVDPELAKGLTPPAFFWPAGLELAEQLPDGVTGHVLMRSSPSSVLQTPPRSVDPIGSNPQRIEQHYVSFIEPIDRALQSEPPRQHALMLDLRGTFRSWYEGNPIPHRPGEEEPAKEPADPLAEPVTTDPLGGEKEPAAEDPDAPIGPTRPATGADGATDSTGDDADPAPILRAREGARLVVVADATFLRDDLVTGEYQQAGGPVSQLGPLFFANLLDWLAQDRDLYALRTRGGGVDRRLHVIEPTELQAIPPERLQQEIDRRTSRIRVLNVVVPVSLLIGVGFVVLMSRWASKRKFVTETEA